MDLGLYSICNPAFVANVFRQRARAFRLFTLSLVSAVSLLPDVADARGFYSYLHIEFGDRDKGRFYMALGF